MLFNFQPELLWFFLGLVLLLGELLLPAFVFLFFGIGAWITSLSVVVAIAEGTNTQLLIFLASSLGSLVIFRKKGPRFARGRVSGKVADVAAVDTVVGSLGVVVEDIAPHKLAGKVELYGTNWHAKSEIAIKKGTTVEIVDRENLTLNVRPFN